MKTNVKEKLSDAYLDLLKSKPYIEITVSELCSKADVSRISFYRNFKSFDDILNFTIDRIYARYVGNELNAFKQDPRKACEDMLDAIFDDILTRDGQLFQMLPINGAMLFDKYVQKIDILLAPNNPTLKEIYDAATSVGIIITSIRKWAMSNKKEDPQIIKQYILDRICHQ
ncbi:MAG: TetR/AcrR family transcriptional regulator [Bacilli bacterium]|nr:TetR/AcrR family transcriptional regulator [Bacilli bacterium]